MLLLDGAANPVHSRTGHYCREISRNIERQHSGPCGEHRGEIQDAKDRAPHWENGEVSLVRDWGVHGWRRELVIQASTLLL